MNVFVVLGWDYNESHVLGVAHDLDGALRMIATENPRAKLVTRKQEKDEWREEATLVSFKRDRSDIYYRYSITETHVFEDL